VSNIKVGEHVNLVKEVVRIGMCRLEAPYVSRQQM
jgi:hypothetical protein